MYSTRDQVVDTAIPLLIGGILALALLGLTIVNDRKRSEIVGCMNDKADWTERSHDRCLAAR